MTLQVNVNADQRGVTSMRGGRKAFQVCQVHLAQKDISHCKYRFSFGGLNHRENERWLPCIRSESDSHQPTTALLKRWPSHQVVGIVLEGKMSTWVGTGGIGDLGSRQRDMQILNGSQLWLGVLAAWLSPAQCFPFQKSQHGPKWVLAE